MPSDLTDEVSRFVHRERLLVPRQPVYAAVSGGMDSMVLLHVLRKLGHPCTVLHVNHGLRGAESDADERFVEDHCRQQGIPFKSKRVDVRAFQEEDPVSTQMAARFLRLEWIDEVIGGVGKATCAFGHHADDAVETLFINLLRGTGRRGWAAMKPRSADFVRPLLCVHRADIEAYARAHAVAWRDDSSNASLQYQRNRIRHELLPVLEKIRPGAAHAIARSTRILRHMSQIGDEEVMRFAKDSNQVHGGGYTLPFEDLERDEHAWLHLYALVSAHGFHPDIADRLHDAVAERVVGAEFINKKCRIVVDREAIIVEGLVPEEAPAWIKVELSDQERSTGGFSWQLMDAPPANPPQDMLDAHLDADRLTPPLILRPWRPGDRMRPIGLGGSKLVSDILIDAKVPRNMKDSVSVLVNGTGEIIWLVGHRIGEGFQATARSRKWLRIWMG
jgi:tRNA(Ile)-lysidine synthase